MIPCVSLVTESSKTTFALSFITEAKRQSAPIPSVMLSIISGCFEHKSSFNSSISKVACFPLPNKNGNITILLTPSEVN